MQTPPRIQAPLALLVLFACNRQFDRLGPPSLLDVSPGFASLAPGETLTLVVTGGATPYHFALSPAPGSGAAASIDDSGAYVAGDVGPATDTITVTDASGYTGTARISVTNPLSVSPAGAALAPGGKLKLEPSGGKPPYGFSLAGTDSSVDASGQYQAGAAGLHTDEVVVTDQTPRAKTVARIAVGQALVLVAAGAASTAPLGVITLVATGGATPYVFDLAGNLSGGNIDAVSGRYQAGVAGSVVDNVRVTDANGQSQTLALTVGDALVLSMTSLDSRPGRPSNLLPTGGQPPYRFAFANKGNHSAGTVSPFDGVYVPGDNVLATDHLLVTDANEATAVLATKVGSRLIESIVANKCQAVDFDGDGAQELLLARIIQGSAPPEALFTDLSFDRSSGAVAQVHRFNMASVFQNDLRDFAVLDSNKDGRDDLVTLRAQSLDLWLARPDGSFTTANTLWTRSNSATELLSLAAAKTPNANTLYFSYYNSSGSAEPPCAPTGGAGIFFVDWLPGATAPTGERCAVAAIFGAVPHLELTTADLDGSYSADLVWSRNGGPIQALRKSGFGSGTTFTAVAQVALPGGFFMPAGDALSPGGLSPLDSFLGPFITGTQAPAGALAWPILLRLIQNGGPPGGTHFAAVGCVNPASCTALGISAAIEPVAPSFGNTFFAPVAGTGEQAIVADGVGNAMKALNVAPTGLSVTGTALPATTFDPTCMTPIDADGDGLNDLAIASYAGQVEILHGEGDGTLARRVHVCNVGAAASIADIDGDGASDVVSIDSVSRVSIYLQDSSELALTSRLGFTSSVTAALALPAAGALLVSDERNHLTAFELSTAGVASKQRAVPTSDGIAVRLTQTNVGAGRLLGATAPELVFGEDMTTSAPNSFQGAVGRLASTLQIARLPPLTADKGCALASADLAGNQIDTLVAGCAVASTICFHQSSATDTGSGISMSDWSVGAICTGTLTANPILHVAAASTGQRVVMLVADNLSAVLVLFDGATFHVSPAGTPAFVANRLSVGLLNADTFPDATFIDSSGHPQVYLGASDGSFSAGPAFGQNFGSHRDGFLLARSASTYDYWELNSAAKLVRFAGNGSGAFQ